MKKLMIAFITAVLIPLTGIATQAQASPTSSFFDEPTIVGNKVKSKKPIPMLNIQNYTFTYNTSCYCSLQPTTKVHVMRGEVVKAWQNGKEVNPKTARILTVQDMLKEARYYNKRGGEVFITWPKKSLAPRVISIDRIVKALDDEVAYHIKKFKPIRVIEPKLR